MLYPLLESDNRADSANKATFTDYAIAVRYRAGYDGIGIGIFGDIYAIDIDNCVENGVLSDMAEYIIARMDTSTEYSLSGAGGPDSVQSLAPGIRQGSLLHQ